MGVFSSIKDAIFGKKVAAAPAAPAPAATPTPTPAAAPASQASAAPIDEVDVLANLEAMARNKGVALNWKTSIVDLMKLIGIDSSLHNREERAKELGYDGPLGGSAEMNIWLHKAVMRELAKNGGKVPAELID